METGTTHSLLNFNGFTIVVVACKPYQVRLHAQHVHSQTSHTSETCLRVINNKMTLTEECYLDLAFDQ